MSLIFKEIQKKKMSGAICVLVVISCLFIGCGEKKPSKKAGEIRLKYSLFSEPQFLVLEKELIRDFEIKNPDIKVDMTALSYQGHHEKIKVQIAGGTVPDLWLTDGVFIMEWAERGAIEDLTEGFNLRFNKKEHFGLQALEDPDGKLWGIPKEIQTFGLFYNKDIFDYYKVKYPDDSWTWDDLLENAKALTKDTDGDGRIDIYGFASGSGFIPNMIYQNGGSILDDRRKNSLLNTPQAREAIEFALLFYKQRIIPHAEARLSFGNEFEMFKMGKVAMFLGQYCYVNTLKHTKPTFNYSVALPPRKVRRACYYDPNAFVITKSSSQAVTEAAWRYIEYHSSIEAQKKLGLTGEGLPFNRKAADFIMDTEYAKEHNLKVFTEMLDQSVDFDVNGCWREWFDVFYKEIEKGYTGVVPIENVVDNVHREVQRVLDTYYFGNSKGYR